MIIRLKLRRRQLARTRLPSRDLRRTNERDAPRSSELDVNDDCGIGLISVAMKRVTVWIKNAVRGKEDSSREESPFMRTSEIPCRGLSNRCCRREAIPALND